MTHLRASLVEFPAARGRRLWALLIQDEKAFRVVVARYFDELRMYLVSRGADGGIEYRVLTVSDMSVPLPRYTFTIVKEDAGIPRELLEKTIRYLELREWMDGARQKYREVLLRE